MGRGGGGSSRGGGGSFGGGSRSSGGRIGGSSSHRGGFGSSSPSSSRGSSSFGGSRGPSMGGYVPPPPRPYVLPRPSRNTVIINNSGNRSGGYGGGGYNPSPRNTNHNDDGSGSGSVIAVFLVVMGIFLVVFLAFALIGNGGGDITKSTIAREALPAGVVNETDYYQDELGWISSGTKLESGMKKFYKETGVQPFLYLTDDIDGEHKATAQNMEAYAQKLYSELFTDEAHVLILFHEYNSDSNYSVWYVAGKQAKTVVDKEGADILMDYIDKYYYSDYTEDEMFSKAFADAADRMMTVTKSPWPMVIGLLVVLALVVVGFMWWKAKKRREAEEAAETERILNSDIHTLGGSDPELKDLEDRYQ